MSVMKRVVGLLATCAIACAPIEGDEELEEPTSDHAEDLVGEATQSLLPSYAFVNSNFKLCMEAEPFIGGSVFQSTCTLVGNQRWRLVRRWPWSTLYRIEHVASGLCLQPEGTQVTTPMTLAACNFNLDRQWFNISSTFDKTTIVANGYCVTPMNIDDPPRRIWWSRCLSAASVYAEYSNWYPY